MEKITVFLCDIYGTYLQNYKSQEDNDRVIALFLENLEKIRLKNHSDKIVFSFISTASRDIIEHEYSYIKSQNQNENIIFGPQFFEDGYISNEKTFPLELKGKVAQILFYLDALREKYDIDAIYYADDTKFYHILLANLLKSEVSSIIPERSDCLVELNTILESLANKVSDPEKKPYINRPTKENPNYSQTSE